MVRWNKGTRGFYEQYQSDPYRPLLHLVQARWQDENTEHGHHLTAHRDSQYECDPKGTQRAEAAFTCRIILSRDRSSCSNPRV